jgi:AhpD family alkylhydroperoxidase
MSANAAERGGRIGVGREPPAAYRAMAAFDQSIERDPSLRELVKIRASQLNGCAYCIEIHTRAARDAGEAEHRIYALTTWRESPLFTPRERAALEVAEAITKIGELGVPDAVYDRATAEFDSSDLANLILAISAINAWNRIAVSSSMVYDAKS